MSLMRNVGWSFWVAWLSSSWTELITRVIQSKDFLQQVAEEEVKYREYKKDLLCHRWLETEGNNMEKNEDSLWLWEAIPSWQELSRKRTRTRTARDWILPTRRLSLELGISLEPVDKNWVYLIPQFQPHGALSGELSNAMLQAGLNLHNSELTSWCSFKTMSSW